MPQENEKKELELTLFDQQRLKFKTIEQVKADIEKELGIWNDFVQLQTESSNKSDKRVRQHWNALIQEVKQHQVAPLQELYEQIKPLRTLSEAEGPLITAFQSMPIILSSSLKGQKIIEYAQVNALNSIYLISHWHPSFNTEANIIHLGQQLQIPYLKILNAALISAKIEALFFEKGIKGSAAIEKKALQDVKIELEDLRGTIFKQIEECDSKIKGADDLYNQTTQKFDAYIQSKEKFSKAIIKRQIKELSRLRKQYTEELALKIPVTYWKEKSKKHRIAAYVWGLTFLASIALIFWFGPGFLQEIVESAKQIFTDLEKSQWSLFFVITFPAFLVVWVLRIFSRNIVMNFHQMHDCQNRAVMTETFLALMSEGKATENDRILILNALFQPMGVASIEDSAPPHWFEIMMERIKK